MTFEDGFNPTNTSTISHNSSNNYYFRMQPGWSLNNNASSGVVSFGATNSGEFNFAMNGNGTVHVATGAGILVGSGVSLQNQSSIATGGFTKTGNGTLTLSGANSYTGATVVSGGTLVINGNQSGATGDVTVQSGATLAGSGTIGGATTIQAGGIHGPGNSPGLQTFSGDLSYSDDSIFAWELGSETTSGRGTAFDAVNVGGSLTVGDAVFRVIVSGLDLGSEFWDSPLLDWDVFNTASSGAFTQFELYDSGDLMTAIDFSGHGSFSFDSATGNLQWSAIPEPSSALAGTLIAAGLLRRRRKPLAA